MTRNQFTFFIIIALGVVLIMTNPKEEEHKAVLKGKLTKLLQKGIKKHTESDGLLSMLGQGVGLVMGGYFIDKVVDNVSRENYFLFSTTTITWEGETQKVGIGILGNVFLSSQFDRELDKILENNQSKASNVDQSDANRENKSQRHSNVGETTRLQDESNDVVVDTKENPIVPSSESENQPKVGAYSVGGYANDKLYFHDEPNENSQRNAYLIPDQVVEVQKVENGFGYVEFTNSDGNTTKGWLMMNFLIFNQPND